MALPAVLLKAKSALKNAKAVNDIKNNVTNVAQNPNLSTVASLVGFKKMIVLKVVLACLGVFFFLVLLIFALQSGSHSIELAHGLSPGGSGSSGAVNLNYDFEALLAASDQAAESPNSPATDLANTSYKTVDAFNQHIKECVEQAGYGTRAGVVAAGKCLISDYIEATGKRLRYSMPNRGDSGKEGISDNTYFDCSSFGWWALYNGGFKKPSYDATPGQVAWAQEYGIATKNYKEGQAGDYLIYDHGGGAYGHNRLIIGTYDDGFYIAEFTGSGGGKISKTSYSGIESKYYLIKMEKYYSDPSSKR